MASKLKRIFSKVASNPKVGSIKDCKINMPSKLALDKIFKDRPLTPPLPKWVDGYIDAMLKIDIRPKPDLYDLIRSMEK